MSTAERRPQRQLLFIDSKVQGALLLRSAMYWLLSVMTIALMMLCWRILTGPSRVFHGHLDGIWFEMGPGLLASLVLLPVVLVDVIKISNRIVGPLVRLRRSLAQLAAGEDVQPLHFRDGDFMQEIANEFNAVVKRIERDREHNQTRDDEAEIAVLPARTHSGRDIA